MMQNNRNGNSATPGPVSEQNGSPGTAQLLVASVASGLAYLAIAWLLFRFVHRAPLTAAFESDVSGQAQLLAGALFGLVAAVMILVVFSFEPLRSVLRDFAVFRFIAESRFSTFDRMQISVVAGVGEEILFRGAIQPLIGVWWTSLLFVALHGYFGFRSAAHFAFGLAMFALSVGLGLLFEYVGLTAAVVGHAVYDFVMLEAVQRFRVLESRRR